MTLITQRTVDKERTESELRSCEATKAVAKDAQKNTWGFNGIWTHDLRDTSAMLYRLSYEASFSSYNGYKLNSLLTCFRRGFKAQLVERRTGIAEVMVWIPILFWALCEIAFASNVFYNI